MRERLEPLRAEVYLKIAKDKVELEKHIETLAAQLTNKQQARFYETLGEGIAALSETQMPITLEFITTVYNMHKS